MKKSTKGFTFIEVMVVVAIIGILAAIALPNYVEYTYKSRRIDGQGALIGLAQAMEKYKTVNSTYVGATVGSGGIFPDSAPLDSGTALYDLSLTNLTSSTFTALATPVNGQVGDGILAIDHTGAKTWKGSPGWDH